VTYASYHNNAKSSRKFRTNWFYGSIYETGIVYGPNNLPLDFEQQRKGIQYNLLGEDRLLANIVRIFRMRLCLNHIPKSISLSLRDPP